MKRLALSGILLLAVGAVAGVVLDPFRPEATLATPIEVIGRATPLRIEARDRGTGLERVEVRFVPATGGVGVVVAAEDLGPRGWLGTGVHESILTATLDASAAGLSEGPGTLQVWARDGTWLGRWHRAPALERPVTIDVTPPVLSPLTAQHVVRLGGAESVVYRVSPDAVTSGVAVGTRFFAGTSGPFADPTLRVALFGVSPDSAGAVPTLVAEDAAGNRRTAAFDVVVRSRTFADKTLDLSDQWLARKVPELLSANGLPPTDDLVAGYLRINRELRAATEQQVQEITRDSAPEPLWQGAFLRMPNSAPLAGFADRRSYVHAGKVVDHQTHLGFDLASLRMSPIPAANVGRVVFAGPLGIYGNAILLDHGLGLFSLYGHLSEIAVAAGTAVTRGQVIGKTGETGLAGGDHLHFGMLVRGAYVDPVEWWDGHWIHDHVEARLTTFPRVASGAPAS